MDNGAVRLAVCSLWTPEIADYAGLTMRNKRAYCEKWGYDFIEQAGRLDETREAVWSKLPLIGRVLPGYDWVFWSDADALFMRDDVPLSDFLDDAADLIWSEDSNGPNAGNFFLRRCESAFDLLRVAYGRHDLINHPWREQEALRQTVAAAAPGLRVRVVPPSQFNSQGVDFVEGQLVVHFAGNRDKVRAVKEYARRVNMPQS